MKCTVLGAGGFIGRHLVSRLDALGHEVFAPPRDFPPDSACDLGNVIYSIGLTADFRSRPFDTVEAHISKVVDFLQKARFSSFLYLSSTRVYGNGTETAEETALSVRPSDPSDLYNLSKLAGEAICLQAGRPNVRVARLSNVVGPEEAQAETFVGALCREARSGHIRLQTALSSCKDYVWIDEVTELLARIATGGRHRLYNVASGVQISHAQWAEALCASTGCRLSVMDGASCASFPPIRIERIQEEFGFSASNVLQYLPDILADDVKPNHGRDGRNRQK